MRERERRERKSRLSTGLRRPPRLHLGVLDRHRPPSLARECEGGQEAKEGKEERGLKRGDAEAMYSEEEGEGGGRGACM